MPADFVELAQMCAPDIAVETLAAIVSLESGFHPFAIRINSGAPLAKQPGSKAEAIEVASGLLADCQDVQLGLGGIGHDDLPTLNLTLADAFEPCLNLKATATLLNGYYRVALRSGKASESAERFMLQSFYGRGDASLGALAQYDERTMREARRLSKRLTSLTIGSRAVGDSARSDVSAAPEKDPAPFEEQLATPPPWDVFASGRTTSVFVFRNDQQERSE
ncbi:lytic transglycosylase domain-containing protein [Sinorhizobium americanum]|uniref:Type IV secretion system protein VirB1 n=1 Tax=Sinorhizobium americanum TaxID=194963 RepID=A0A4R2ASH4_9HYPH|nr:lytic transglycosylase domain-containing protein [Sinorhizobium americanum]TCN16661.1 type IV secretion system protein VirB1 [Sinorhizobium americanum]